MIIVADESVLIYRDHASSIMRQIQLQTRSSQAWSELDIEDQAEIMLDVLRLYGDDAWTSLEIRDIINGTLPGSLDRIPCYIN